MNAYQAPTDEEIQRINRLQRDFFSELIHVFDPPLPEGVPERLKKIVASARIARGDVVLDVGTGTGILVPLIQEYEPDTIFVCDLSHIMLAHLQKQYPYAKTIAADIRDLAMPDGSIDVVFMNACYPNIVDKGSSFANTSRIMKPGGRMVISHPLGKSFVGLLKEKSPFPLDDFPEKSEAEGLLEPYGFEITDFVDEEKLYILVATKRHGG
ncbi:MAG: methyltransferase domain-containing protein [Deltaproteobacteria bacterium]|nr:methyltransferase domain-containing protein [Deltaproteobacteria bacterium]